MLDSGMSIESAVEKRIREAMERGEFDDLPGEGKPIDLAAYFSTPEDLRMAYSMLKSNEFVPAEVELLKEVAALKERLKTADNADRAELIRTLNAKNLEIRLLLEKQTRRT